MDRGAAVGIGLAVAGIGLGLYLDGGKVGQLLQPTAALIVFGGTIGAVIVQFPFAVIKEAVLQLKEVFLHKGDPAGELIERLARYAALARRNGVMSLDSELELVADPFMKRSLMLAVDGVRPADLRETMELSMNTSADQEELLPKVFEAAGGYAPTIGILGAVIGLIQVMQKLQNINEVGKGIAVAFVATIYGVGAANLILLPCAGRLKLLMHRRQVLREMILEGVLAIADRASPRALESRLAVYLDGGATTVPVTLAGK